MFYTQQEPGITYYTNSFNTTKPLQLRVHYTVLFTEAQFTYTLRHAAHVGSSQCHAGSSGMAADQISSAAYVANTHWRWAN